jgi:DHA2 family multidrug resistance protein-like MFS transporter
MNDATRELGAALGIAVLGSVAASRYAGSVAPALRGLSRADQDSARTSIAGALRVASSLPAGARENLISAAQHAFVNGIHLAVIVGATLAVISAGIVWRNLPHTLAQDGAVHGPVEALEEVAAMGLGGVPPVFADAQREEEHELERDRKRHCERDRRRSG